MRADEMTKLLDDMVEIAEACGYEVPEGLDAEQFLTAVMEMVEQDKELDEEARTFFVEAVNALTEEDEDESASSAPAEEPAKKPFPFKKKGEKEDEEESSSSASKPEEKDDEGKEEGKDEEIHFAVENDEVLVSEDMSTMLDQMVDLIESSGYEVEAGLSVADFLEAVEELLKEKPEIEEAKGLWLERAHKAASSAYAVGVKGKMQSKGAEKTQVKAFATPHKIAK
jgi:hypothetical protein